MTTRTSALLDVARRPIPMPHHPLQRFYDGGALTQQFRGLPNPLDSAWSEDWVGSTTTANNPGPDGRPQGLSTVAVADGTMIALADLIRAIPEDMLGTASLHRFGPTSGLLVKLLSPAGAVPLHAHPTRAWAAEHLQSPHGKTEAWILLDTPGPGDEPAYAAIGFREWVTRDWFTDAVRRRDRTALRDCLHRTPIAPGEVYVAAAGVPHLLGPRELFIEVQEPTDHIVVPETDGADDSGATMGLGWDLALDMIDYTPTSRQNALGRARQTPTLLRQEGDSRESELFAPWVHDYFQGRRLEVNDALTVEDDRFAIIIITSGNGYLEGDFGRLPLQRGQAYAIPAAVNHRLHAGTAPLVIVRCLGPDPERSS